MHYADVTIVILLFFPVPFFPQTSQTGSVEAEEWVTSLENLK